MKSEELLSPRFEVIAEYPNSNYKKGDILIRIKHATNEIYEIDEDSPVGGLDIDEIVKYPHLFKKLNWWEYRKAEDMPKKLTCKAIPGDDSITEIVEWDMKQLIGWINKEERTVAGLLSFNPEYGYFPVD